MARRIADGTAVRRSLPLRYALIQLPELALVAVLLVLAVRAGWFAANTAAVVAGLWLIKEIALYPLYRHALRDDAPTGGAALTGQRAVARTELAPDGWVSVRGERWRARAVDGGCIAAGTAVEVVAADGLTLTVRRSG
ncbi:NfeD family protein [Arhodomonas aquaeolei]|uniref:NfeD family protein n=1 Tax=Arhodomonas aquaeolei TaxID=2369 RepID=UPI002169F835|nr:NfeD family protein [Arhodomonas aquaeolei]MCS4505453.1 NfeD family protein [Arhodomonas aquaeolei]